MASFSIFIFLPYVNNLQENGRLLYCVYAGKFYKFDIVSSNAINSGLIHFTMLKQLCIFYSLMSTKYSNLTGDQY